VSIQKGRRRGGKRACLYLDGVASLSHWRLPRAKSNLPKREGYTTCQFPVVTERQRGKKRKRRRRTIGISMPLLSLTYSCPLKEGVVVCKYVCVCVRERDWVCVCVCAFVRERERRKKRKGKKNSFSSFVFFCHLPLFL
jgi:hypothetical protein